MDRLMEGCPGEKSSRAGEAGIYPLFPLNSDPVILTLIPSTRSRSAQGRHPRTRWQSGAEALSKYT